VQQFYDQHTDDILCLALHPTEPNVASGQVIPSSCPCLFLIVSFLKRDLQYPSLILMTLTSFRLVAMPSFTFGT
jgi:hypothetical protein